MESVNCLFVLTILVLAQRALCESGDIVTTTTVDVRSSRDETESSVADGPVARAMGLYDSVCTQWKCPDGTRCVVEQSLERPKCIPESSVCPCRNGGVCRQNVGRTYCDCSSTLYFGIRCQQTRRAICSPNPCKNDGVCQPTSNGHRCQCPSPYSGPTCQNSEQQRAIDHCHSSPCLHGGVCTARGQSYTCYCNPGFGGTRCENSMQMPDHCLVSNPCSNDCKCVASCRHASGYYCRGDNGYLGKNCTIPPPAIQCRPNQVIVTVDGSFLREYDMGVGNSVLHMSHSAQDFAAEDCLATTTNGIAYTFVVHLPFTKCGTTVEVVGGKMVVTNNIWLNRATAGGYDMPVPVICFVCTYEKEYIIVSSLRPAIDQPQIVGNTGIQRAQGFIELCKVYSSCPSSCPSVYAVSEGAAYTVGEMIHLNIGGDRSPKLVQGILALKTLYLSCDGQPGSAPIVWLVTNGCPASSRTYMPAKVGHSGQSASICASFQVPMLHGCTAFFIHAEVETCGLAGCTYDQASCSGGQHAGYGRRKRRATENGFVDFGPIYVINGSYGLANALMFPNTSTVDSSALIDDISHVADGPGYGIVVGLSVLCLLIVLAVAFIAGICFRGSLFPGK